MKAVPFWLVRLRMVMTWQAVLLIALLVAAMVLFVIRAPSNGDAQAKYEAQCLASGGRIVLWQERYYPKRVCFGGHE